MNTNTAIKTPRVEACIEAVMLRFPSPKSTAYYEAVHQELAPLARELEIENAELRAALVTSAEELEEWRFTNKVDELQRENERFRAALDAANHRIEDLTTAANRCINDALGMVGAAQQDDGELPQLSAHDQSIIDSIEAMACAKVQDRGWWNIALANSALRIIDQLRRTAIAQRAGSGKDVEVHRLRDHLDDAKELIQKMMKQEAKPYGYCWYNEHMEYRFTRLPPNPAQCVIGEMKPVFERAPAVHPDSERDAALLEREMRDAQSLASLLRKERERFEFLHSTNKDAEGWEWGVARVRGGSDGRIEYLWGTSDHLDVDAAMAAQQNNKGG